jgi:hypothetical protein
MNSDTLFKPGRAKGPGRCVALTYTYICGHTYQAVWPPGDNVDKVESFSTQQASPGASLIGTDHSG